MKRLGMLRHLSFAVGAMAMSMAMTACGDDDDGGTFDARVVDAPLTPDAPTPDARVVDAAVRDAAGADARQVDAGPTFSGTMALHDIELYGIPQAGHGLQTTIDFGQSGVPAVASGGMGLCTATVSDVTVAAQNPANFNEGTVTFTVTPTAGSARTIPCAAGSGATGEYNCVVGQGTAGAIANAANNGTNVATFTATGLTFTDAMVGAYLSSDVGSWPIVGVSGATAALAKPSAAALPTTTGAFVVVHGVGPVPFTANADGSNLVLTPPELLADTDTVKVQLTPGGSMHHAAYTTATGFAVGKKFDLDTATKAIFDSATGNNLIASTTDVTLGCDTGGATPCSNPSTGLVTVISIETTDNATGNGPTTLATPTKFRGSLTCASLTSTAVTIPADLFAVLRMGNPVAYRISVFRDGGDLATFISRGLQVVAGHGIVAFKSVAATLQ